MTSPPYADMRKNLYGGIPPDEYVAWFEGIAKELYRILKPSGSFVLNIKENARDGELLTYVLELILAMREWGWRWTEEYIWYKRNSYPGSWSTRFSNQWERLLHFTKGDFDMYRDAVKVPRVWQGETRKKGKQTSKNGNNYKIKKPREEWDDKYKYPGNVLDIPISQNTIETWHPAVYPKKLPQFFINLFTLENDIVFDPFAGSGTTLIKALDMGRQAIGLEIKSDYCKGIKEGIDQVPPMLF